MTWKPIDSAPRDGTPFLAWWGNAAANNVYGVIHWGSDEDGEEEGWIENSRIVSGPTHYMDLPPPPEEKSPSR